mmetsp:Transcript_4174/g.8019  ORF Transcript_4174/g.8019 Transcript_4174/m.8019 type:complete len:212 (-) Transcript_4174:154-789(-)
MGTCRLRCKNEDGELSDDKNASETRKIHQLANVEKTAMEEKESLITKHNNDDPNQTRTKDIEELEKAQKIEETKDLTPSKDLKHTTRQVKAMRHKALTSWLQKLEPHCNNLNTEVLEDIKAQELNGDDFLSLGLDEFDDEAVKRGVDAVRKEFIVPDERTDSDLERENAYRVASSDPVTPAGSQDVSPAVSKKNTKNHKRNPTLTPPSARW